MFEGSYNMHTDIRPVFVLALSKIYGGHKCPKSQKPSQFKGEISKNRKNPQNLNAFQKNFEFTGGTGGRGAPKDGPGVHLSRRNHKETMNNTRGIEHQNPTTPLERIRYSELLGR